jgi:hypothetical protein
MRPEDMTREERLCLLYLNKRLFELEKQLKKEALEIIETMKKRVSDENDWISDFEIECTVDFYLREDDPAYSDEEDNFLAEFKEGLCVLKFSHKSLLASEENWNDMSILDMDHPDQREHHCWFYHQLYDHTDLTWEDMIRIGDVWVNIDLTLQHQLKLT